ncbi:MAG: ABC transporter permease [Chloroflexota bacterium]|nr:ABC transporter permease [Chloroflexota bacterium]
MATTEATLPRQPATETVPIRRGRPGTLTRLRKDRKGRSGVLMLLVLAVLLFLGPPLLGVDPLYQDLRARLVPPLALDRAGAGHLLGTDQLGRDLLARLLVGGQTSLSIGLVASVLAAVIGVAAGMIAGYAGRFWDGLITSVADVQLTFPNILLALSVMVVLGPGIGNLILVLVLSSWVFQARIIRADVLSLRHRDFVEAGRAIGARDSYLLVRYVLPNIAGSVLVLFTLTLVRVILAEASLSFLGLGIMPPAPSWGGMLAEGRQYLASAWWAGTFPGLLLMVTIVAINLVGDSLRDIFDPRLE